MSAAAVAAEAPPPKGKKKLILIVAIALVVLLLGGGGAAVMLMKKSAAADEDDEDADVGPAKTTAVAKRDPKSPPAYLPLENFVVNLADRDAERYAQVGVTLEMASAAESEQSKAFMPAIRNNILMVLAHKRSTELLERTGKEKLAAEIQRAASRAMGIDIPEPEAEGQPAEADGAKKPRAKKKAPPPASPIIGVHFSSFIVQ